MKRNSLRSFISCSCAGLCLAGCLDVQQQPLDIAPKPDPSASSTAKPSVDVVVNVNPHLIGIQPGESEEIYIEVTPPEVRRVDIALLGDAEGAYVDNSYVMTDDEGKALVRIHVPAASSGFRVRASSGGAFDEAKIDVLLRRAGTLRLEIPYTGLRPIETWWIGYVRETPCAELDLVRESYGESIPATATTTDGALPVYAPIIVEGVPASYPVTLLVRGEEYVYGCREGIQLQDGQERTERVVVVNRPLQLSAIDLPFELQWELTPEVSAVFDLAITNMVDAFTGGYEQDAEALIERMATAASDEAAFRNAAESEAWSAALAQNLQEPGATRGLRSRVLDWLSRARTRLFSSPITGQLQGSEKAPGSGLLELDSFAGVEPASLGVPRLRVTFYADPSDVLGLDTKIVWPLSSALSTLADQVASEAAREEQAANENPASSNAEIDSAVSALEHALDCGRVSSVLAGADGQGYPSCDASCLAQLCEAALVAMWDDVVSAVPIARMEVSAAGPATIAPDALPLSFAGLWAGSLDVFDTGPVPARGPFRAGLATEAE